MNDSTYHFIVGMLDLLLWGGELVGEEYLPRRGPAVFVANHTAATGPIAASCSIPLRLYSWIAADMVDPGLAAAYLQWDFVEKTLHFKPPFSTWFARFLSRLTVPFLSSLGCIPVYKGDPAHMSTALEKSMQVLRQEKFLLVFPEDNLSPRDPLTGMGPFQHTFTRLGEMFHTETGRRLEFYPVTVHPKGLVILGKPLLFDPLNHPGLERRRLNDLLEATIRSNYLQAGSGAGPDALSVLTPRA
jgi:hypothetical protein